MNFSTCLYANIQFFVVVTWLLLGTLHGPISAKCLVIHTLQTSKRYTFRVSAFKFPSVLLVWDKTVSCWLCARQSKGTLKTRKNAVFRSGSAHAIKFRNFSRYHPFSLHLAVCRWNRGDLSSQYTFWFGLEPPTRRSRSKSAHRTSVFRTTIGVCKILSRSVEIWQYEDQKPVLS